MTGKDISMCANLIAWIDDLRYIERNEATKGTWAEVKARKTANHMTEILDELDPNRTVQRYGLAAE